MQLKEIKESLAYDRHFPIGYDQDDASEIEGNKIYEGFKRYKTGVHFGGNVSGQRIFNFDNIPYSE